MSRVRCSSCQAVMVVCSFHSASSSIRPCCNNTWR
ncbi:hypothetical protein GCE86_07595 [Micromonospora terminaliae]|uniref:Uncharacterized protein n=1 Tax=Micromonospora terminaliae TaxID=1914461 RepID=A0ABX6E2Z8_9ACTN|nr:hypothetical protein GCE86_07595 [Micromonospora terminaliae]